jgi:hypothetical protein
MTDKREISRRQWEQELIDRQDNITRKYPKTFFYHYIEGPGSIVSLLRLGLGIVLLAFGARVFPTTVPASIAVAILAIAFGIYFFITAFDWKDSRK